MMPHLAEECWAALGHDTLVADAALAGGRAGPAGREHHHPAGPDQRQEAGRRDRAARRRKRRDRGCRAGAGCGTKGARRQAPEKGHRRPAEDRECGGLSIARRSPASPRSALALALAGLLGRLLPAAVRRADRCRRRPRPARAPGARRGRADRGAERHAGGAPRGRGAQRPDFRPDRRRRPVAATTHQLKISLVDAEPAGDRRHHHRAARRAAITASTPPTR